MNQDWTLQGGNQKSPETAKLQGHLALSMSNCLEIRRDPAEPDSWVESCWINFNPTPPVVACLTFNKWVDYFLSPYLLWTATCTFQIRFYYGLRAQYTPPFHDTIIRDRRLLQSQTLRWGCRHHKENESAKGKHTKTQQRSITVWNQT